MLRTPAVQTALLLFGMLSLLVVIDESLGDAPHGPEDSDD